MLAGALELAEARACAPAATAATATTSATLVTVDGASEAQVALAFDPQTAGGLLVSLPESRAAALEQAAGDRGLLLARIGSVEPGAGVVLA